MIRRTAFIIALIVNIFTLNSYLWAIGLPEAKITIEVVGEAGNPIDGARVGIGFTRNTGWGTEEIPIIGYTDSSGQFVGSASALDYLGFTIKKDSYYNSYGNYQFKEKKLGRWEPWNPTVQVVLRKMEKPVPMYARDTKMSGLEIPVVGKSVGFDLAEYDWVSPYGKGNHADFIFKLDRRYVKDSDFDSTLTITFSNKHDGIQLVKEDRRHGSEFKLPRYAPKSGYQPKIKRTIKAVPGKPIEHDFQDDNNYIFRVRSEEKDGKLGRAMYGKIQGDIEVYPGNSKTARINFTYFLNPDYTKNLEFGKNLFTNLKEREQVWIGQ